MHIYDMQHEINTIKSYPYSHINHTILSSLNVIPEFMISYYNLNHILANIIWIVIRNGLPEGLTHFRFYLLNNFVRFWQIQSELNIYRFWIGMNNFITIHIIFVEIWFRLYLPSKWYFEKKKKKDAWRTYRVEKIIVMCVVLSCWPDPRGMPTRQLSKASIFLLVLV